MEKKEVLQLNEQQKLKIALSRSHEERFYMLMKLIRINSMLKSAKIVYPDKKSGN